MSQTLARVKALVSKGELVFSLHGQEEMEADGIGARELVEGTTSAVLVEDYPDYWKGPCVLVLQHDKIGKPIHVVWGIERDERGPATVVTAYRPDPSRWSNDFLRRL